ncbi:MAG: hypothetical protein OXF02_04430 [Simkaniaceae bacterium]|nr:hypothetical protein [Simkaniaceae bacterium]
MASLFNNYGYKPIRDISGNGDKAETYSSSSVEENANKANGLRDRIAAWRKAHPKVVRILRSTECKVGCGVLVGAVVGGIIGGVCGGLIGHVPGAIVGTLGGIIAGVVLVALGIIVFSECRSQPTDPQSADPQSADPQSADPQSDNQVADVSEVGAGPGDANGELSFFPVFSECRPQPTDPQPTDPQPTDPQPTDPQSADPQPTDPQSADPQSADPQSDNQVADVSEVGAGPGDANGELSFFPNLFNKEVEV